MPAELRVRLLGGFHVEVAGRAVPDTEWQRHGAIALVKVLTVRGRLHREQAIDLLWPDADPELGQSRLNKALHFARRVLGADRLRLRDEMLSLDQSGLWTDVGAFEEAARRGDTDTAIALYTGDLLPENRFDVWADQPRTHLRDTAVGLLLSRATRDDLERVTALDPLHEEAHARLMQLEAAEGHRHRALRRYDQLATLLLTELNVEPTPDLQRLHKTLTAPPSRGSERFPATAEGLEGGGEPRVTAPAMGGVGRDLEAEVAPDPRPHRGPDTASATREAIGVASGPPPIREERKLVTVLDADLRGTRGGPTGNRGEPLRADDDPESSRREIAEWTALLTEIVAKWGGTAQPVVGGGVIGVFGYPVAREDHAARALWAGHEILERFPHPIRLGADTGEIIAPDAGDAGLPLIGGAVLDTAARLRAAAGPGSFLVADRTGQAAARHGDFRFAASEVGATRLVGASWVPGAGDGEGTPMVGRGAEMRAVLSLIDEAAGSRRPRLITVAGPAGIGKSRLVREVVGRRAGMRVLRGRCLAAGDGITYWALGEILREACGIPLGESGERAQQRLREGLGSLLPERTIFALAATAGIRLPGNPLDQADPRDVDDELGRAWPRLATALAVREPLLLIVEDLHWAGAPLVAMLTRLVARAEGPVIVLSTARPEFLDEHGRAADVVSLRALPEADGRALLEALPHQVAPEQRARILTRADGNPYFLEQLAAHVAEGGRGTLPDTVHALLAARVDALPAAEKQVLRRAAVIGRTFWATPLGADRDRLQWLENRGLIRARPASSVTGQDEYAFQHALLRDVAYAGLPVAERAAGHAEAAAWLEEVSRERVGEVIELVAVHYTAAADGPAAGEWVRGKAFRSLIAAGVSARRRYAVKRALELHERARRYAANPAEHAEALEATGDDHETAYAGDEAVAAWRAAITALPKGDRRARLCLKTAQMLVARWGGFRTPADPALGDRVVDEGLAAVRDPSTKAQLLAMRALCGGRWAWTGRSDPVPVAGRRRAATDACALADRIGAAPLRALALLGVAAVHFLQERYEDAVLAVLEEVALVEQEGRDRDRALGHTIASLVIGGVRGDYELALEHAFRSYEWARDLSPHDRLHGTAAVMICLEQLGRDTEVDVYLDEHLALRHGPVAEMACPYIRSGPLVGALALARRGEPERAKIVAATVDIDLAHPGNAEVLRSRLFLELGDVATARSLAERLMSMNRRPGPEEIPHEALALLAALEAAGDHKALQEFLPRAKEAAGYLALITPACDRAERILNSAGTRAGMRPPTGRAGYPRGR